MKAVLSNSVKAAHVMRSMEGNHKLNVITLLDQGLAE